MKEARTSQEIAEACGVRMYELDQAARSLGVVRELRADRSGSATEAIAYALPPLRENTSPAPA